MRKVVTPQRARVSSTIASLSTTTVSTNDVSIMLVMWFVFAFALFSFMGTKFHHYIFPAVPPIAMLIGIVLDDMLAKTDTSSPRFALAGDGLAGERNLR